MSGRPTETLRPIPEILRQQIGSFFKRTATSMNAKLIKILFN